MAEPASNPPTSTSDRTQGEASSDAGSNSVPVAQTQFGRYALTIIIVWAYSFLTPAIAVYFYFNRLIIPRAAQFLDWPAYFHSPDLLALSALTPLVVMGALFVRLLCIALFVKAGLAFCNWRSPQKELVAAKGIGKEDAKAINYYHWRGVFLRLLKWEISKSAYPWLVPWAFTFVGANNIGKGTVFEDQFYTQEFLDTGKNVYIGQGSIVSSHLVEGKYGAITLKRVTIGEGTVIGAFNAIAPGSEFEPRVEFLPMSGIVKFRRVKGFNKYFGLPVGRMSYKRYIKALDIPEEFHDLIYQNKALKRQYKGHQKQAPPEN